MTASRVSIEGSSREERIVSVSLRLRDSKQADGESERTLPGIRVITHAATTGTLSRLAGRRTGQARAQ